MKQPKSELLDAVESVARAVPLRSMLPILDSVLLAWENGWLRVAATDLDVALVRDIKPPQGFMLAAPIAVAPKMLIKALRSFGEQDIEIAGSKNGIVLKSPRQKIELGAKDGEDYPPIPVLLDDAERWTFAAGELKSKFAYCAGCVANESRPVLTGVHLCDFGGDLVLRSADGFRARTAGTMRYEKPDRSLLVPASIVKFIRDDHTEIRTDGKFAIIDNGDGNRIVTLIIQGSFPDFSNMMLRDSVWTLRFLAEKMLPALDACAMIWDKGDRQIVRLSSDTGEIKVSSLRKDEPNAVEVLVGAQLEQNADGKRIKWAADINLLRPMLKEFADQIVTMQGNGPSQPALFSVDGGRCELIMPMFVEW